MKKLIIAEKPSVARDLARVLGKVPKKEDYFEKFINYESNQHILVTKTGDRLQPVYARLDSSLKENLRVFLETGERKIDKWYTACGYEEIFFEQNEEMFININSKDDIEKNRSLIDRFYG